MIRFLVSLLIATWLASASSAHGQELRLPVEKRNQNVLVRGQAGLEDDVERLAAEAPQWVEEIRHDLRGLPSPERVEIRLVRDSRDLGRAAPRGMGAPPWAVGVAYRGTGVVVVARRHGSNPVDIDNTAEHELAHLALDAAMGERHVPRWLNEGFAYLHSSDFSLERSRTLTGMAWTGDVIPLSEIDSRFPAREQAAHRAYAQSYDLVAFLALRGRYRDGDDDGNRWPFRDFLSGIAEGLTLDEAAQRSFGASMRDLFDEWYASMRERYMLAPIGLFGIAVWAIGGLLLVLAYARKRRLGRRKMREWEEQESLDPPSDLYD